MTRCSGCEAPNPTSLINPLPANSPIGIKRAPITPMKPSPKFTKQVREMRCRLCCSSSIRHPLLKFPSSNPLLAFAAKTGWKCDTCMLQNDDGVDNVRPARQLNQGQNQLQQHPPKLMYYRRWVVSNSLGGAVGRVC
eukprot:sb/3474575/